MESKLIYTNDQIGDYRHKFLNQNTPTQMIETQLINTNDQNKTYKRKSSIYMIVSKLTD